MVLLEIKNLCMHFVIQKRKIPVLKGINLSLSKNETLVLAGESGSGKTLTCLAITKLYPQNAILDSGQIIFKGKDALSLTESDLLKIRGREIAYVFQEPISYLNPVLSIGAQIAEIIQLHQKKNKTQAWDMAGELINLVGLKNPLQILKSYPHQLSGGMNQRVFLAMAIACRPELLIADEPTSALDVSREKEIIELFLKLKEELKFSLIFITHNLALARKIADKIAILYSGEIVEEATPEEIFNRPRHQHTQRLVMAYEKLGRF